MDQRIEGRTTDRVSPLKLAETLESDANHGLEWLAAIKTDTPALCCEKADIEAWAHLNYYFADKLRAAVSYELYRRTGDEAERLHAIQLRGTTRSWTLGAAHRSNQGSLRRTSLDAPWQDTILMGALSSAGSFRYRLCMWWISDVSERMTSIGIRTVYVFLDKYCAE